MWYFTWGFESTGSFAFGIINVAWWLEAVVRIRRATDEAPQNGSPGHAADYGD